MSLGARTRPRRKVHPVQVGATTAAVNAVPVRTAAAPSLAAFRADVMILARGRCQAQIHPDCSGYGDQAHHRQRSSQGGPDTVENGRWVCHLCHDVIHFRQVDWARRHLWLISAGHPLHPPVNCDLGCTADHRSALEDE